MSVERRRIVVTWNHRPSRSPLLAFVRPLLARCAAVLGQVALCTNLAHQRHKEALFASPPAGTVRDGLLWYMGVAGSGEPLCAVAARRPSLGRLYRMINKFRSIDKLL